MQDRITEYQLLKFGFKNVGIGGCTFVFNKYITVEFYDYLFYPCLNGQECIPMKYIIDLKSIIDYAIFIEENHKPHQCF